MANSRQLALKQVKLGWLGDLEGYLSMESGIVPLCESALSELSDLGVTVEPCKPNFDFERLWQSWLTLRHWTICGAALPLYQNPSLKSQLKPEAIWEIEGGLPLSGLDISAAAYTRTGWYQVVNQLFEHYDFLVLPSAQVFPFSAEIHWPRQIEGIAMDTYHRWMEVSIAGTLSGCPIVNLPIGMDAKGRPMGIQVIGPYGEDSRVLNFAMAYEYHMQHLMQKPVLQSI